MNWEIVQNDVLDWAETYTGEPFMAMICDPPYHLGANGFMGKSWDSARYGISFQPDTWAALAQHLLPGAFGMAFASSRGWHRLAVAIEDGGLRIHPSIFGWSMGSGFPKASRIGERIRDDDGKLKLIEDERFTGHRYGLQALKPALEPIIVFQKPYDGKPVESITATGAGTLWIDGGRLQSVVLPSERRTCNTGSSDYGIKLGLQKDRLPLYNGERHNPQGRWPANFCLVHHPECKRVGTERVKGSRVEKSCNYQGDAGMFGNKGARPARGIGDADGLEEVAAWRCHPDCPARKLGEQSGERKSTNRPRYNRGNEALGNSHIDYGKYGACVTHGYDGTGTAARFFHQSDWSYEVAERLANADPVRYQAKASSRERSEGLSGVVRLRSDLTEGQKTWVLSELEKAEVLPLQ